MAKRKSDKPKRPTLRDKTKLSAKSYSRLIKEASNVRRRIRDFAKRSDAENYFVPDAGEYTLTSLISRLIAGEKFSKLIKEIKNITAEKIRSGTPLNVVTNSGYKLKPSEKRAITKAVSEANKNIREARNKFSDFADIMPTEFSAKDIVQNVVSADTIKNKIADLSVFTPENLIPTSVNDSGEAGTVAEYTYYKNILERENERRAKIREENDPLTQQGYFLQQVDYDSADIPIEQITTMEALKKRAETWDDPARVYRANLFLSNYEKALDTLQGVFINHGYWNSTIEERFDYIRGVIGNLYYNEKAITYASTRIPSLSIQVVSPPELALFLSGELDFDEIYNSWIDIEDEFL